MNLSSGHLEQSIRFAGADLVRGARRQAVGDTERRRYPRLLPVHAADRLELIPSPWGTGVKFLHEQAC
jgi:hypothetical protein